MDKRWLICAKEDVFVFVEEEKRTGEDQSNYTGECEKTVEGKIKLILSTMPSCHASRFVCETTFFFFISLLLIVTRLYIYPQGGNSIYLLIT